MIQVQKTGIKEQHYNTTAKNTSTTTTTSNKLLHRGEFYFHMLKAYTAKAVLSVALVKMVNLSC